MTESASAGVPRKPFAIYAITKHGLTHALRLHGALPGADLYVSPRLLADAPGFARRMELPMGSTLQETFTGYDCHVHVISVGAVVRMVAHLLQNKKVDPAIVCVDDAARFAVCLLSGHVGRGNQFTQRVAEILDATPVITTASDVTNTLTVDILGRELGWVLDHPDRNVTAGCAAVVNQARVALVQETGEPGFWPLDRPWPPGVEWFSALSEVTPAEFEMLLVVSDRDVARSHPEHAARAVIYRPKSLVLGLGCDRGTPRELLERGIRHHLAAAGLDLRCVRNVATIEVKRDEPGLLDLCNEFEWPLVSYSAAELDRVEGVQTPSDVVRKYVGTRTVAEGAALLSGGAARLLLPKKTYTESEVGKNMTIAVTRIPFSARLAHSDQRGVAESSP